MALIMKIENCAKKLFWMITVLKIIIALYIYYSDEKVLEYWLHTSKEYSLTKHDLKVMTEYAERTFDGLNDKQSQNVVIEKKKKLQEYEAKMDAYARTQKMENGVTPYFTVLVLALFIVPAMYYFRKMTIIILISSSVPALYVVKSGIGNINSFCAITLITGMPSMAFFGFWLDGIILLEAFGIEYEDPDQNPVEAKPILAMTLVITNVVYLICMAIMVIEEVRKDETLKRKLHFCLPKQLQNISKALKILKFGRGTGLDSRFEEFAQICITGEGKAKLKKLLADKDFNINQRQVDTGNTGLHLACLNQNMSVVQALLDNRNAKRVNINVKNSAHKPPLILSAATGNKNLVHHLLKQPKLKMRDSYGEGAIVAAIDAGHYAVALSIAEEITKRGYCLRDYSRYLNNMTLIQSLRYLESNSRNGGEAKEKHFQVSKENITKAMLEAPGDGEMQIEMTQEQVHEELKEFLECGICYEEFGDSPVLACHNDHWICSICYPRNRICPWCKIDIQGMEPRRCRTSEKMLKLVSALKL